MNQKLEGIVIGERNYSETSKILDLLTQEHGVIGVISKGCRSMKSPLRSVSAKLTYGIFNLYYKEGKLSPLKSVDVLNSFRAIKTDIKKISYAAFLLDLTGQVMKHNYSKEIYELLISGILKIEENFDPAVISNIVELKCLDFLGVTPVMDACSACGSKKDIITLSPTAGGYICKNCFVNDKIVSHKTIKMLRMLYYVDISKISKLDISPNVKTEINDFLDDYYERYTGLYLKSKTFLKNLNKISV